MGGISSLRTAAADARGRIFPQCYEELTVPVLAKEEAFDPAECGDDDIWPCAGVSAQALLTQHVYAQSWPYALILAE